jgi:N utilization substance protein A
LSPAKELAVEVNEKEKIAYVSAPKEELPLIIGRDGQNVRLASKLAGYNIEVKDASPVVDDLDTSVDEPSQEAEKLESEENSPPIATSQEEKTEEAA